MTAGNLTARWAAFTESVEPAHDFRTFLVTFYAIWTLYDVLDLAWGGTAASFWLFPGHQIAWLTAVQLGLTVSQAAVLYLAVRGDAGLPPIRAFMAFALVLRAIEATLFFQLNDFFYYCVTAFIMLQATRTGQTVTAWPRRVLLYQTAWIYLATAFLKLNPHWLSGGHLWVRLSYVESTLHLPHAAASSLQNIAIDRWLAIGGIAAEFSLGVMLLLRAPRAIVVATAIGIHGFAALFVNVFFFGASMVAQDWYVSGRRRAPESRASP